MVEVVKSATFDRWLQAQRPPRGGQGAGPDRPSRRRQPGDIRPVDAGISELRIDYGPGYRVYYLREGQRLLLLLTGGDKSTQDADIKTAHTIAQAWSQDPGAHP